jgi:hypothetical protein
MESTGNMPCHRQRMRTTGEGGRASHHTARSRAGRGAPGVGHAIDADGGGHWEEQGGHRGLVVGHAPWPHRQVEQMAVASGGADVITTGWSRWPSRRVEQIRSPPGGVDGRRIGLSICGRRRADFQGGADAPKLAGGARSLENGGPFGGNR